MSTYRNQFPSSDPGALRLALVGESLGANEAARGVPFCGAAGQHLDLQLAKVGLLRSRVFVGNVCAIQPPRNEFDALDWTLPEVQDGIAALLADLATFRPNLVLTMGNVPLHLFSMGNVSPLRRKRGSSFVYDWPRKVTTWRGSMFWSSTRTTATLQYGISNAFTDLPASSCAGKGQPTEPEGPVMDASSNAPAACLSGEPVHANGGGMHTPPPRWKCLATLHPAFCLRAWAEWFNFQRDLRLAAAEALTPNLALPELDFDYGPQ